VVPAEDRADLAYRILDVQLVDVDGRRCGRVDDIELSGGVGAPLRLEALLSGRGVYPARLAPRLRRLGEPLFGRPVLGRTVQRVPWTAVEDVQASVLLREPASELGLARGDRLLASMLMREERRP